MIDDKKVVYINNSMGLKISEGLNYKFVNEDSKNENVQKYNEYLMSSFKCKKKESNCNLVYSKEDSSMNNGNINNSFNQKRTTENFLDSFDDESFDDDDETFIIESMNRNVDIKITEKKLTKQEQNLNDYDKGEIERCTLGGINEKKNDVNQTRLEKMNKINKEIFHHSQFRECQIKAIDAALNGNDAFIIMPTGSGKSLCYLIPGLMQNGVTIVIEPLNSLIEDQVQKLTKLGIKALHMNQQKKDDIINDGIRFIFTTPEKIVLSKKMKSILNELYSKNIICRFVIDEAHCVIHWGYDFRNDYLQLSSLRIDYPKIPIMALTATARKSMKTKIKELLDIIECIEISHPFGRKNLFYDVVQVKSNEKSRFANNWIIDHGYQDSSGIIFCSTIKEVEVTYEIFKNFNYKVAFYYADMDSEIKSKVQNEWMNEKIKIMVATCAFGMGIDKPNVRFVIHYSIPRCIEDYYQESGRSGRDGNVSHCLLMWNYFDYETLMKKIISNEKICRIKNEKKLLQDMFKYAMTDFKCRSLQILKYFEGNDDLIECNNMCDFCIKKKQGIYDCIKIDMTTHAKNIARIIEKKADSIPYSTTKYLIKLYKGLKTPDDNFKEAGEGREFKKEKELLLFKLFYKLYKRDIIAYKKVFNSHGFIQYWTKGKEMDNFLKSENQKIEIKMLIESPLTISSPEKSPVKKASNSPQMKLCYTETGPKISSSSSKLRLYIEEK